MNRIFVLGGFVGLLLQPSALSAQSLGTFQWRLEPYCNTLTLTVFQDGDTYRLQGYEDLCDSVYLPQPVSGTGVVASDGGVMIGLTTGSSGGFTLRSTRVTARIELPSLNGFWVDDGGRRGDMVPVTGPVRGGTARGDIPVAFVHVVTSTNRRAAGNNVSCFSHPVTDFNSAAMISVTPNRGTSNALRPFVASTVSLYLHLGPTGLPGDLSENVWCISRDDSVQMPLGAGFNVQILSR